MSEPGSTAAVLATAAAKAAIARLKTERGPLMFFQSGGCADGSLPMCFTRDEPIISDNDVLLGTIDGCPFYIDSRQFEVWKQSQLILDVDDGAPEGLSLSAADHRHFITRSSVCLNPGVPAAAD